LTLGFSVTFLDGIVGSDNFQISVIPAKAGHAMKQ
jgi:hypothetical protein